MGTHIGEGGRWKFHTSRMQTGACAKRSLRGEQGQPVLCAHVATDACGGLVLLLWTGAGDSRAASHCPPHPLSALDEKPCLLGNRTRFGSEI